MNITKFQSLFSILFLVVLCACAEKDINFEHLNETIYLRHRGADMPAYVHGNGLDKVFLIYLHGGPGGFGLEARINTMITEVEENNAVVYFDQRGSGAAQGNYSADAVSIDAMADDVLALVQALRARYGNDARFFLMGASWGGTLGSATLLKSQDDFLGWIDVAGVHSPSDLYQRYQIDLAAKAIEQIALGNSVAHWEDVLELVENASPNYNAEYAGQLNNKAHESEGVLADDQVINEPQYIDENGDTRNIYLRNNVQAPLLLAATNFWRDTSYTDRLTEITIPSMVLWGKHDIVVPTFFAYEAYDNLGSEHKELHIFELTGHSPLESEPELYAKRVIAFINEFR